MAKRRKGLGFGFPDELAKVSFKNNHFRKLPTNEWEDNLLPNFDSSIRHDLEKSFWRTTAFLGLLLAIFFFLFVRLFHLQIVEGKNNRKLADGNRIQVKIIHAPRGVIFDRNGKVLASNSPGFRLFDTIRKKFAFVTREQAFEMEVKNNPNVVNLEVDSIRKYSRSERLAHVLGYVGEISENQLKTDEFKNYKVGDRIGQSGIESYYEGYLRGVDGGEIIEVDAAGQKLRTLRTVSPIPGQNVYLTIDADLQDEVYKNLKSGIEKVGSCCGAAIIEDPNSGEILSLVSFPSFDNNIFTDSQKGDLLAAIFADPHSPVLNRGISGTYPPGSTFKIISSIAGLGSGKINAKTTIEDTGEIFLGQFRFTNWYFTQYGKTEGSVDLVKALKRSNDTYYYRVGQTIGEKLMIQWARKMGLGSKMGIDLAGEDPGLIPDENWKQENFKQPWYPGDTLHMSIGQGFVLTTPLQVLGFTSYVASNGNLYKPHILLKIAKEDGSIIKQVNAESLVSNLISETDLKVIKKGLEEVVIDGGTAWPFFTFPIPTAGKTGTAEFGDEDKTHAWYTSYAPVNEPKVALTILIEAGGEGSTVASPIAKEIYRWYFSPDKAHLIKDTNAISSDSAKVFGE